MALRVTKLNSTASRVFAAAVFAAVIVLSLFFAKWCLANAMSTHSSEKDAADLAVSLGPADPQTHFAAAVIYEKTFEPEDLERSRDEYERAALLSPYNYLSWLELARADERAGDTDRAESAYRRSTELAPNYAAVQWSYGNFLVRTGRREDGFALISRAAAADPTRMPGAVSMVLAFYNGDDSYVRQLLGNSGIVNLALAKAAIATKDSTRAFEAWNAIEPLERRTAFAEDGRTISSQFAGLKQFRMAAKVFADVSKDPADGPKVDTIANGGFEKIDTANTNIFDWQISATAGQQIGLSTERKTEGDHSLFMAFNTMKAAEFRQVFQTVAVEPGGSYTLSGSYRSEMKGTVAWEAVDASDGKVLGRAGLTAVSGDWTSFQINFSVPVSSDGVTIRLVRDGCITEICPISGKLWLDALALTRQR